MTDPRPEDLLSQLAGWCRRHADVLGLSDGDLVVEQLPNPSGWYANVVCSISDGSSTLVAKLGRDEEKLGKVYDLRDVLVSKYRCPPILGWVELDDAVGVVMSHVRSEPAPERLIRDVIELVNRLHADGDLAGRLPEEEQPDTMREAFADIWIDRLTTDLDELEAEDKIPPFVSFSLVEWMRRETAGLARLTEAPAFGIEPTGPVHGDLHLANVLLEPDGRWWIVDWDDIHCGDPAADLATLLLPLIERGAGVEHLLGTRNQHFRERFGVCARAVLLDLVVDSLADWADAGESPGMADQIRRSMRATHERGLNIYRLRYER